MIFFKYPRLKGHRLKPYAEIPPGTDFSGVQFDHADLKLSVMQRVKMTGTFARGVNFSGARMHQLSAQNADFDGAVFRHACLEGADFSNTSLVEADFRDSNTLREWELGLDIYNGDSVRLTGANLTRARLDKCDWRRTNRPHTLGEGPVFVGACMRQVSARDARLSWGDFSNADLTLADFKGADLSHAKFLGSQLSNTSFEGADLSSAIFTDVDLSHVNLKGATLNGHTRINGERLDDHL